MLCMPILLGITGWRTHPAFPRCLVNETRSVPPSGAAALEPPPVAPPTGPPTRDVPPTHIPETVPPTDLAPTVPPGHGPPTRLPDESATVAPSGAWPSIPGYEILEELGRGGMGVV